MGHSVKLINHKEILFLRYVCQKCFCILQYGPAYSGKVFCFCFYWRLKLLTSRITRILIVQVRTFTPPNSDFIAFHRLIAFNIKYLSAFRVQQLAQINSMETFTSLREASPCPSARVTSHILWPHQIDPSIFTPSCALLIQQCLQPS